MKFKISKWQNFNYMGNNTIRLANYSSFSGTTKCFILCDRGLSLLILTGSSRSNSGNLTISFNFLGRGIVKVVRTHLGAAVQERESNLDIWGSKTNKLKTLSSWSLNRMWNSGSMRASYYTCKSDYGIDAKFRDRLVDDPQAQCSYIIPLL